MAMQEIIMNSFYYSNNSDADEQYVLIKQIIDYILEPTNETITKILV